MPHDQISFLKGSARLVEEHNAGAHYYAFSPVLSTSQYSEVLANIVLPRSSSTEDKRDGDIAVKPINVGQLNYTKRHAFISLGIYGSTGGVDLGLMNKGSGWYPTYYDVPTGGGQEFDEYTAPSNATNAVIVVKPLASNLVGLYVQFLNASGTPVKTFDKQISVGSRTWNKYYRLASLVPGTVPPKEIQESKTNVPFYDNQADSTFMINAQFTNLQIYNKNTKSYEPWGIYSPNNKIENAFMMSNPKCQVTYSGNSETARIDHWG